MRGGEWKSGERARAEGEKGEQEEALGAREAGRRAAGRENPRRGELRAARRVMAPAGGRREGGGSTGRNESLICASKASPPHFMCQGY